MPQRVLIVQSDGSTALSLAKLFAARGDQAWQITDPSAAMAEMEKVKPELVLIDLHLPGNSWMTLLRDVKRDFPQTGIIITNRHPDFQREMLAREQGARVYLREPFTQRWLEQAINRLGEEAPPVEKSAAPKAVQPRVRIPVRIKITLPYLVLALVFALGGAYVVSQFLLTSIQDRFHTQLAAAGKQNADWMVQEENRRLETLRILANTQGMAQAIASADAQALRNLVLPLAVNSREEAIEILDTQGSAVLSLHHVPGQGIEAYTSSRGDVSFGRLDFVRYVLDGRKESGQDKNAGLVRSSSGDYFYVSGPVLDAQGQLAGVVLVGNTLASLVQGMHQAGLAQVSLYSRDGQLLVTSLPADSQWNFPIAGQLAGEVLSGQDHESLIRDLTVTGNDYSEILGPWEARGGVDLGMMGTAMLRVYLTNTSQITRTQVFILVAIGLLLVLGVGVMLANQITQPLLRIVRASSEVAKGNLEIKVDTRGNDEITVLAHTFNAMVAGLQEGSMYRDLLGRTVSPEVREQLRQTFTSGNLRLEGQESIATVLMTDIRGFTNLSEKVDPATVFRWLNEYFSELVPIITANNGVVNKFDGDSLLVFFGILPRPLSPAQSAYSACQAAIQMLTAIERLNLQRVERNEPPLATGIGINTGIVTAGGLGTSDRLHYTIIGDTVNTTQRIEALNRQLLNVTGVVISASTYQALNEHRDQFRLDPLGLHVVKGKAEQVLVYRLLPLPEGVSLSVETAG